MLNPIYISQINGLAMLVGLYMLALVSECSKYAEDGANFLKGHNTEKLIEISTDGYIKCCKLNPCTCEKITAGTLWFNSWSEMSVSMWSKDSCTLWIASEICYSNS